MPAPDTSSVDPVPFIEHTRNGKVVVNFVAGQRRDLMTTREFFTKEEFLKIKDGIKALKETPIGRAAIQKLKEGTLLSDAEAKLLEQKLSNFAKDPNAIESVEKWVASNGSKVPEAIMRLNSRPVFANEIQYAAEQLAKMEVKSKGTIDVLRKMAAGDVKGVSPQLVRDFKSMGLIVGDGSVSDLGKLLIQKEGTPFIAEALRAGGALASKGAVTLEFVGGMAALAIGPIINYFTEQKEKARIAPALLTSILGKERSAQAYQEYHTIMTAQLITSADPTMMSQSVPQALFEEWANKYNIPNDAREKLMPESILFRAHTPEERLFAEFYEKLPTKVSADTPQWMRPYVELKQQMIKETFDLSTQKFTDGLMPDYIKRAMQIQADTGIDRLKNELMKRYAEDMQPYTDRNKDSPIYAWTKEPQTADRMEGPVLSVKMTATPSKPLPSTGKRGNHAAMKKPVEPTAASSASPATSAVLLPHAATPATDQQQVAKKQIAAAQKSKIMAAPSA